jgi:DNA-binding transcriptional regulator YhcF (GntR family)
MPTRTPIGETLHGGSAAGDDVGVRITLGQNDRAAASEGLARAIEARIHRGSLAPGERLPPVRALAAELGLAPNTVAKAYRRVEEDGLIEGRGRSGTFVVESMPRRVPDRERRLAEAADAFVRRARQLGASDEEAVRAVRDATRSRR